MTHRNALATAAARRDLDPPIDVASRDLIIAAAGELIRESGYQALTVDDVRLRAGVSRATFYFYFRNKKHLLISTASTVMDELFDVAGRHYPDKDEFARIVLANVSYLSVWRRQSAILGQFYALSLVDAEVREIYDAYRQKFEVRIAGRLEAIAEGHSFTDLVQTLSESWYRAVYGCTPGKDYDFDQHRPAENEA
jgi:AcrR family transcriptional regulator